MNLYAVPNLKPSMLLESAIAPFSYTLLIFTPTKEMGAPRKHPVLSHSVRHSFPAPGFRLY